MNIPSIEECYRIMGTMEIMEHIAAHSIQVCRVATLMVDLLAHAEIVLNRDLVRSAAMLHDITKTRSLTTGENHAATGATLITDLGYPEVGAIIGQHVRLNEYFTSEDPEEAEIVNYADKRVIHDTIGTLDERRDYIMERYGTEPMRRKMISEMFEKTYLLEEKLFGFLPMSPANLATCFDPDDYTDEFDTYMACCG